MSLFLQKYLSLSEGQLEEIFKLCTPPEAQQIFCELLVNNCPLEKLEISLKYININFGRDYILKKNNDINPLLWACYNKKYELVKFLVKHGADINRLSNNMRNSILISFKVGDYDSFKYLLSQGADIQINNKSCYPEPIVFTNFMCKLTNDLKEDNPLKIIIQSKNIINI